MHFFQRSRNSKVQLNEENPSSNFIEKLPPHEMTECLKFYRDYKKYSLFFKNMQSRINELGGKFKLTSEDDKVLEKLLNLSEDELIQWKLNFKVTILHSLQVQSQYAAVSTIESGMKAIDSLNNITKNKTTYGFNIKKLKKRINNEMQNSDEELLKVAKKFNWTYPQIKEVYDNIYQIKPM